MKKFLVILAAVSALMTAAYAKEKKTVEPPAFEKEHSAVILKSDFKGNVKDNIRIINRTQETGLCFTVYFLNPKSNEWTEFGSDVLKGFDDTAFIDSKYSGRLKKVTQFAIVSDDGKDFKYKAEAQHNDLYIYIE